MKTFKGIGIQHKKSGKIYSADGWDSRGFDPDEARGIAVGNGEHSLCLYKKAETGGLSFSFNRTYSIPGVCTTIEFYPAKNDFSGKENTDVILKAVSDGLISNAPAAQWARETYGSDAYLPGLGELLMIIGNDDEILNCSALIDGNIKSIFNNLWCIWSSTQFSEATVWIWNNYCNRTDYITKTATLGMLSVACTAL